MPPLLLDDDEAIAIAVGLRTAARASVTGIEETSVRALVKLEQVLPSHLRRRVNALQTATVTLADHGGPTVDPRDADVDRRRLPRPRAPALRLPGARRGGEPARRRAPHAGEPRAPLVPRRLGLRPRGLAHLPRRPPQAPVRGRRALRAARAARRRPGGLRRSEPVGRGRRATRRASRCTPRRGDGRARALRRIDRRGDRRAHVRAAHRATTTLDWLAVRSRCSASISRSTSRPSSSSACVSWRRACSERRAPGSSRAAQVRGIISPWSAAPRHARFRGRATVGRPAPRWRPRAPSRRGRARRR